MKFDIMTEYNDKYGLMRSGHSKPIIETHAHMAVIIDPINFIVLHNSYLLKNGKSKMPGTGLGLVVEDLSPIFKKLNTSFKNKVYIIDLKNIDKLIKIMKDNY